LPITGAKANIIPAEARIDLSVRSLTPRYARTYLKSIDRIVKAEALAPLCKSRTRPCPDITVSSATTWLPSSVSRRSSQALLTADEQIPFPLREPIARVERDAARRNRRGPVTRGLFHAGLDGLVGNRGAV
jgi:metal-dependent amidase/aminoacylase/carboxypeptidase family protein